MNTWRRLVEPIRGRPSNRTCLGVNDQRKFSIQHIEEQVPYQHSSPSLQERNVQRRSIRLAINQLLKVARRGQ